MNKVMTICFLVKGDGKSKMVCLAEKKRGFRAGKINGFGGKLETGETIEECAVRETREESCVTPKSLVKRGEITFCDHDRTFYCHVYIVTVWDGEPEETEEMLPAWYEIDQIPFDRMGQADPLWIPQVLRGQSVVASFYYDKENTMYKTEVTIVDDF